MKNKQVSSFRAVYPTGRLAGPSLPPPLPPPSCRCVSLSRRLAAWGLGNPTGTLAGLDSGRPQLTLFYTALIHRASPRHCHRHCTTRRPLWTGVVAVRSHFFFAKVGACGVARRVQSSVCAGVSELTHSAACGARMAAHAARTSAVRRQDIPPVSAARRWRGGAVGSRRHWAAAAAGGLALHSMARSY